MIASEVDVQVQGSRSAMVFSKVQVDWCDQKSSKRLKVNYIYISIYIICTFMIIYVYIYNYIQYIYIYYCELLCI